MKKNKKIFIGLLVLIIVIGTGLVVWVQARNRSKVPEEEESRERNRITEPINVIPVSERPYMLIEPQATGHHINLILKHLVKDAQKMEYELEYQSGELLQGAFDSITIEQLPLTHEIMLGSCSAGGACSYHEDIKGGSLLMRFTGGEEKYVLKSDWRYLDNSTRETAVASRDAKFQLESDDLATQRYLIVYNSPGAPEGLEAELKSDIYTLTSSGNLKGTGTLTIRAAEESESLKIYGYDGADWTEYESTVDGKSVTAEVELMEAYVVAE